MKKLLFVFLALPLMLVVSCNEKSIINTSTNDDVQSLNLNCPTDIDAINTYNPYDSSGWLHNAILRYAADENSNIEISDSMFNHMKEFVYSLDISQSVEDALDTLDRDDYLNQIVLTSNEIDNGISFKDYRDQYVSVGNTAEYDFFTKLHNIYENSPDSESAIDSIIEYEFKIINSSSLDSHDLVMQLSTTSVYRYTIKFWTEAIDNECHPYHDYISSEEEYNDNSTAELRTIIIPKWVWVDVTAYYLCMKTIGTDPGGNYDEWLQEVKHTCMTSGAAASTRYLLGGG